MLLATAATVIASQAVITGAYSVTVTGRPARLPAPAADRSTPSESTIGQIYVPWINWLLMVSVLTLVFAFRSSAALAFAYGMAVTGTITITTLLFFYIARYRWRRPAGCSASGAGLLLLVDLLFVAANLTKLMHGAWLPLLIALTAFTVMTTWQRGRAIVTAERDRARGLAARVHRRSALRHGRASRRCRARRSSSTAASRPRRWRCGRTSSTTTSATSTC